MRVTKDELFPPDEMKMVFKAFNNVKYKFGFINIDIVKDLWQVIKNPETIKTNKEVFNGTLKGYKGHEVDLVFKEYEMYDAYAEFLRKLKENPIFPPKADPEFFKLMWELLAELWQSVFVDGARTMQGVQTMAQKFQDFTNLINEGKDILELFKNPNFDLITKPPKNDNNMDDQFNLFNDEKAQQKSGGGQGQGFGPSLSTFVKNLKKMPQWKVNALVLSLKFKNSMEDNAKGVMSKSNIPGDRISIEKMNSSADIMKVLPSQEGLPQDLFHYKFSKNDLVIRQWNNKTDRKQVMYMVIDSSTSMQEVVKGNATKASWATAVALAYLNRVTDSGDRFYVRFYAGNPHIMIKATNRKEAQKAIHILLRCDFDGCSTNTVRALDVSLGDILDRDSEVKEKDCQMLLITDGEDSGLTNPLWMKSFLKQKGKIELHSVALVNNRVGTDTHDGSKIKKDLIDISNSVWEIGELSSNKTVDLISVVNKNDSHYGF